MRRLADRKAIVLHALSRRFRARAAALGLRTNPAFAGTYDFAARMPFAELFAGFLDDLPDGGVIMCHPGLVDAELARLDPITRQREQEYGYLASEDFANLLRTQGVALA
jgi:chitin disaccharide deacetylase